MQKVVYSPFVPQGSVNIPPSKSDVHRAVICAALANGVSKIYPVALSNDIKATIECIKALGAKAEIEDGVLTVDSTEMFSCSDVTLDCGESGSTLRFFIPVAAFGGVDAKFVGHGQLPNRPIGIFTETLPEKGVNCITEGGLPLQISGKLKSGVFEIPGNVSSQFITGLLFVLPLLDGDSKIVLTSPIESVGYIDMTISTMSKFGVTVTPCDCGWEIKGNQSYMPCVYKTEGDWSQAAFFMVAGAISGSATVKGVYQSSNQGDKRVAQILKRFGACVEQNENSVTVKSAPMQAITIDASQIPDIVPVLSVCACFAEGTTKVINAGRLRIKECDRLKASADLINSLGGKVKELEDGLEITGVGKLRGGYADGCNDHRIVMSAAVCAAGVNGKIECSDPYSINKSYPDFFEDYKKIGGVPNVIDLR